MINNSRVDKCLRSSSSFNSRYCVQCTIYVKNIVKFFYNSVLCVLAFILCTLVVLPVLKFCLKLNLTFLHINQVLFCVFIGLLQCVRQEFRQACSLDVGRCREWHSALTPRYKTVHARFVTPQLSKHIAKKSLSIHLCCNSILLPLKYDL